jgi:hypothetical protein
MTAPLRPTKPRKSTKKSRQETRWVKSLEEARRLNYHSYSCWTTGGEETCQKCWSLAEELMKRRLR